jgi:CRISPR-associated protein Cas1
MTTTEVLNTLYVHTAGSHLSLDGGAVRCYSADDDSWRRLPLARVDAIVLIGAVNASTDLILRCAEEAIPIHWLSEFGKPRALVLGPLGHGGATRSAQHAAHSHNSTRLAIARSIVEGKIANMLAVLRTASHDASGQSKQALRDGISRIESARDSARLHGTSDDESRYSLLGLEGATSRFYFTALRHTLRPDAGVPVPERRTRRPATDPVNATMSFAYGLTRIEAHGAIHAAGLDPAIGYLHGDRSGQPSLVLDLMEEFRPVADRIVTTLFNRKQLRAEHFTQAISGAVELTEEGRRALFTAWHEHRRSVTHHRVINQDMPHALVPLTQARLMARFLTSDTPEYLPFRI